MRQKMRQMWVDKKLLNSPLWREYYSQGYLDYSRKLDRSRNIKEQAAFAAYLNGRKTAEIESNET